MGKIIKIARIVSLAFSILFIFTHAASPEEATVQRVIDGDTIVIKYGSKEEKVRLIGVNTPETVDTRRPV